MVKTKGLYSSAHFFPAMMFAPTLLDDVKQVTAAAKGPGPDAEGDVSLLAQILGSSEYRGLAQALKMGEDGTPSILLYQDLLEGVELSMVARGLEVTFPTHVNGIGPLNDRLCQLTTRNLRWGSTYASVARVVGQIAKESTLPPPSQLDAIMANSMATYLQVTKP